MMLLIILCTILMACGGTSSLVIHKHKSKPKAQIDLLSKHFATYEIKGYGSRAAYRVAYDFEKIPPKYRPMEGNELARTLLALDIKWGDRANHHGHTVRFLEEYDEWFWTCICLSGWKRHGSKHTCKLWDDYGRLVWEFHEIREAANAQERAFKLSGRVEAEPEHLERLLTRAREESKIIKSITSELLGLPEPVDNEVQLKSIAQRVRGYVKEWNG